MSLVIGIDQSSGSRSKCGVCVFDPTEGLIIEAHGLTVENPKAPAWVRIRSIAKQLRAIFERYQDRTCEVRVEATVMRGKGGETLQRMVGAIIGRMPERFSLREVHNMSLKVHWCGRGSAEKSDMGEALLKEAYLNHDYITKLIADQEWDVIDAICIAAYEGDMG
jgi:hypothetical protein